MTYPEAIQFLFQLQLFGANFGLETTRQLADAAGKPEAGLRFIHVAGTNGKGSTCAMLASIYQAAGLRVGLYTSPHLVSFRERFQINGNLISEDEVVSLVSRAQDWIKKLPPGTHPTFFEVITVMALAWFAEQQCDLAVWETGLGGRLDATNIVSPLAAVITNVQLDHEKWLGESVRQIATEKAGIIKPGVPVVTAADDPAALDVIQATAAERHAPLHVVTGNDAEALELPVPLPGRHQQLNAAVALKAVELLQSTLPVSLEAMTQGLAATKWPGRFQTISRGQQTLILDGAHNPAGARALAETVRRQCSGQPATLVLAVLQDKNCEAVCHTLAPIATRIIISPVSSPRSATTRDLAVFCRQANPVATIEEAASAAEALARLGHDRLVIVTGSLYFVGEVMELIGVGAGQAERQLNEWVQPARTGR